MCGGSSVRAGVGPWSHEHGGERPDGSQAQQAEHQAVEPLGADLRGEPAADLVPHQHGRDGHEGGRHVDAVTTPDATMSGTATMLQHAKKATVVARNVCWGIDPAWRVTTTGGPAVPMLVLRIPEANPATTWCRAGGWTEPVARRQHRDHDEHDDRQGDPERVLRQLRAAR